MRAINAIARCGSDRLKIINRLRNFTLRTVTSYVECQATWTPLHRGYCTATVKHAVFGICTSHFTYHLKAVHFPTQLYLCVLCGSENKQRLFPFTLTDWFYTQTESVHCAARIQPSCIIKFEDLYVNGLHIVWYV